MQYKVIPIRDGKLVRGAETPDKWQIWEGNHTAALVYTKEAMNLISAAPDLLEACKAMIHAFVTERCQPMNNEQCNAEISAMNAISKAEGK